MCVRSLVCGPTTATFFSGLLSPGVFVHVGIPLQVCNELGSLEQAPVVNPPWVRHVGALLPEATSLRLCVLHERAAIAIERWLRRQEGRITPPEKRPGVAPRMTTPSLAALRPAAAAPGAPHLRAGCS